MNTWDVIVIGAGAGGLASAVELSARGKSVLVLEAGPDPGGKMGRRVVDGVEFDTGPSVLTMIDVLESVFKRGNTRLKDHLELIPTDGFRYLWPDGAKLLVHFDLDETLASVEASFGTNHADDFRGFMTYTKGIWDAAAPNFVYGDAPTMGSAVKLGVTKFRELLKIDPMRTMMGAIESRVKEPHLRDLLARYATYNGSNPWSAPATLNCIAWVELGLGCYGVKGGMFALAQALEKVAKQHHAEFRYNTRVARIMRESGRVTGVRLEDGSELKAHAVVCNADVAHLTDTLMPDLKLGGDAEPSMSGWTGVLKASRTERPSHTVLFPSRPYRQEFEDIFTHKHAPTEPTVYLCAQEKAHGRRGWEAHEPVFAMINAPAVFTQGSWEAQSEEAASRVHGRLLQAGLIEAGDEWVWTRSPDDLARTFEGSRGSIYGASSNSQFSAFQRPSNALAQVPGLYLASGSAHPGGGVPMCLLSGQAAARAIK